jgi:DNA-binding IclR family transcriptional regulator
LVTLLIKKKIIDPKELMEMMDKIRKERYKTSEGKSESGATSGGKE